MYELANGDPSEKISLEALQKLVDSGEVNIATRIWCEPMEDCETDIQIRLLLKSWCNRVTIWCWPWMWPCFAGATFDGASWRCGHGARTLMYETQDEAPSEETPMARVQELVRMNAPP
jgi:hypothetical protein